MTQQSDGEVLGIDVSRHQGDVDHDQVAASGMRFCICKASEGRDYEDPKFEENIRKIREVATSGALYLPGAYHFARPDTGGGGAEDGAAEAEWFCDVVERACEDVSSSFMPPALDFEKYSDSDARDNVPWVRAWVDVVTRRLGRKPMIYTGKNVWKYEVGDSPEFVDLPLWQVYYSATDSSPPRMPWVRWSLWQFSGGGDHQNYDEVPGVGVVDVNRWHGTETELLEFAHSGPDAPPDDVWSFPRPPEQLSLDELRGVTSPYTARVQGLLMSHGYGPSGLASSGTGLPDGIAGDRTVAALESFKKSRGLPADARVCWQTWWALAYDGLR